MNIKNTYISLKELQDDKTVLKNPHKGWYYHYVDNGFTRAKYRDGIINDEQLIDFPGLNHLYIRFDWADIEKEEGVYDWRPIDEITEHWSKYGFTFSFRMCTYEANNSSPYAIPKWLADKNVGQMIEAQNSYEPYYNNELYLKKLEMFMREYAKKFNGNPLVEFIDIGTFGTWGEGHTAYGSRKKYNLATVLTHINMHLKYFTDTMIIINDDLIGHMGEPRCPEYKELKDYCAAKGIGIRDDGICVKYYAENFGYDTLRDSDMFGSFTDTAPCDIELQHYSMIEDRYFKNALPYLEALKNTKATYSGFHGYTEPWLTDNRSFTEYASNRLGYWYFIDGIELPVCVSGMKSIAAVYISNRGFSKAYHRYFLKLYAVSENGTEYELNSESPDNTVWKGGSEYREHIIMDFRNIPEGKYSLAVSMNYGGRKIKLGIKQEYMTDDGKYILCEFEVVPMQTAEWRFL